jgi:hypothetical protein
LLGVALAHAHHRIPCAMTDVPARRRAEPAVDAERRLPCAVSE